MKPFWGNAKSLAVYENDFRIGTSRSRGRRRKKMDDDDDDDDDEEEEQEEQEEEDFLLNIIFGFSTQTPIDTHRQTHRHRQTDRQTHRHTHTPRRKMEIDHASFKVESEVILAQQETITTSFLSATCKTR